MLTVIFVIMLFLLSRLAAVTASWRLVVPGIAILFALVGLSPYFRGCESLGVFVLVAGEYQIGCGFRHHDGCGLWAARMYCMGCSDVLDSFQYGRDSVHVCKQNPVV